MKVTRNETNDIANALRLNTSPTAIHPSFTLALSVFTQAEAQLHITFCFTCNRALPWPIFPLLLLNHRNWKSCLGHGNPRLIKIQAEIQPSSLSCLSRTIIRIELPHRFVNSQIKLESLLKCKLHIDCFTAFHKFLSRRACSHILA